MTSNARSEKQTTLSSRLTGLGGALAGVKPYWLAALVLIWSVLVGVVINLVLIGPHALPTGDELDYSGYAINVVSNHQFIAGPGNYYWPQDLARRPPAYPFLLAATYALAGIENYFAARMVQVILVGLLAVTVFILGKRFLGTGTGLAAGLLTGVYPYLANLTTEMRPEPLYLLAVYAGIALFAGFVISRRPLLAILCGISWGVAALTRSDWAMATLMFLLLGVWRLKPSRDAIMRLSLIAVVVAAVILPWTARNYMVFGKLVPIATNMGTTIAGTNNPLIAADPNLRGQWVPPEAMEQIIPNLMSLSETERDSAQTAYALNYIKNNPVEFASLGISRLIYHWHLYFPLTHQDPIELFGLAVYFIVALLAIAGAARLLRRREGGDVLAIGFVLILFSTLLAFTVRSGTRFRLLVDPYLILLAAYALVSTVQGLISRKKEVTEQ